MFHLFSNRELRIFFSEEDYRLDNQIDSSGKDYLLSVNISEFVDYLQEKFSIPLIEVGQVNTEARDSSGYSSHGDVRHRDTVIVFRIPFSGDPTLVYLKPSTFTLSPPVGNIYGNEIEICIESDNSNNERVKREFQIQHDEIIKWISWINADIKQYNDGIRKKIETKVNYRRNKLLKDQDLLSSLGFPLKERQQGLSTNFSLKITKPFQTSKLHKKPEPVLDLENYDNILKIIELMSHTIERTPKAFKNHDEENLRFLFLIYLNAYYEGQATGETFNFQGKTDILIRSEDRNIFIAECAFWEGEKYLQGKINQLLGYLSWRDTKTAIILFNRNKDLSRVRGQIKEILEGNPNFKKHLTYHSETGFRCLLHHNDDKDRDLYLTIIVFEVPK